MAKTEPTTDPLLPPPGCTCGRHWMQNRRHNDSCALGEGGTVAVSGSMDQTHAVRQLALWATAEVVHLAVFAQALPEAHR